MKSEKLLGICIYQADVKPKGSRNFRRVDMSALVEYEIAAISQSDLVLDAVVATEFDVRHFHPHHREKPKRLKYAGFDCALWRPMTLGSTETRVSLDEYAQSLRLSPSTVRRDYGDPILESRNLLAAPKESLHLNESNSFDEATFDGKIEWTNKSDSIATHQNSARLLLSVDGEIWRKHPGPSWLVQDTHGSHAHKGAVLLGVDTANFNYSGDMFRADRLTQANELCLKRWGKSQVYGSVERMDDRFVTRDDLVTALSLHLHNFLHNGEAFVPYLKPEATSAFIELHRMISMKTPSSLFSRIDADLISDKIALLRASLSDRSLPNKLFDHAKAIISDFDKIDERIRLERAAQTKPRTAAEDDAIASLAACP